MGRQKTDRVKRFTAVLLASSMICQSIIMTNSMTIYASQEPTLVSSLDGEEISVHEVSENEPIENEPMENAPVAENTKYGTVVSGGSCGATAADELYWTVYDSDGDDSADTIVISGEGKMADYSWQDPLSPWYAFRETLRNLALNEGITYIGESAFSEHSALSGNLVIPQGVTEIGEFAFFYSGFDGKLILPDGLKKIGYCSFCGCTGLKGELTIPEGVTSVEREAFSNCRGLKGELRIPDSVTNVGERAFCECSGFNGKLTLSSSMNRLSTVVFLNCSGLTGDVVIPESISKIEVGAFCQTNNLGNIYVPQSVTHIDSSQGLEPFYMNQGVHKIYDLSGLVREDMIDTATTTIVPGYTIRRSVVDTITKVYGDNKQSYTVSAGDLDLDGMSIPEGCVLDSWYYTVSGENVAVSIGDTISPVTGDIEFKTAFAKMVSEEDITGVSFTEPAVYDGSTVTRDVKLTLIKRDWEGTVSEETIEATAKATLSANHVGIYDSYVLSEIVLPENSFYVLLQPSQQITVTDTDIPAMQLVVNRAPQTLTGAQAYQKIYGDDDFSVSVDRLVGDGAVRYAVVSGDDVVSVNEVTGLVTILNAGTAQVRATAAETEKYSEKTFDITISVAQAETTVSAPTGLHTTYRPDGHLSDIALPRQESASGLTALPREENVSGLTALPRQESASGLNAGAWTWEDGTIVPTVKNNGYVAVFIPDDSTNYKTVKRTLSVHVAKGTPSYNEAVLSGLTIRKGHSLSEMTLPSGFRWDTTVDTASPQETLGELTAKLVYNPDPENYNDLNDIAVHILVKRSDAIEIAPIASQTYTGKAITPKLEVYHGDTLLRAKKDYTVKYKNNKNAGTATVTVTGKGNYKGTAAKTFAIEAKAVSDNSITAALAKDALPVKSKSQKPMPVVKDGTKKLKAGKDFKVSYYPVSLSTADSSYPSAIGAAASDGGYEKITKSASDGMGSTGIVTGSAQDKIQEHGIVTGPAQDNIREAGTYLVAVEGIHNYAGVRSNAGKGSSESETIAAGTQISLSSSMIVELYEASAKKPVNKLKLSLSAKKVPYTGKPITVAAATGGDTAGGNSSGDLADGDLSGVNSSGGDASSLLLTVKDGKNTLSANDYTITCRNNTDIGTAEVIVRGAAGSQYAGSKTLTFAITGTPIRKAVLSGFQSSVVYTGSEIHQNVMLTDEAAKAAGLTAVEDGETVDEKAEETAKETAEEKAEETAEEAAKETAEKIADEVENGAANKAATEKVDEISEVTADGERPTGGRRLVEGVDYMIAETSNRNAGKATLTITGKGAYTGTIKKTYTIKSAPLTADMLTAFEQETEHFLTGAKPAMTLTFNGQTLVEGEDYTVLCKNNKAVTKDKKAAVTIKGKGNFTGTLKDVKDFTITQKSLSADTITVETTDFVFQQNKKEDFEYIPKVTVYDNGAKLPANAYTVTCSGNSQAELKAQMEAGKTEGAYFTVTVEAAQKNGTYAGNYTGSTKVRAYAAPYSLAKAKVTIFDQIYTGAPVKLEAEEIKAELSTTDGVKTLEYGRDFTIVSYQNNIRKGTATVTLRGTGTVYGGTKTVKFKIVPKDMKIED